MGTEFAASRITSVTWAVVYAVLIASTVVTPAATAPMAGQSDALGDGRRAIALFQRAIDLTHTLGDGENEVWALNYGALAYDRLGERPTALAWLTRARPLARAASSRVEAITLNNLGLLDQRRFSDGARCLPAGAATPARRG